MEVRNQGSEPSLNERFRMRREAFGAGMEKVAEWSGLPAPRIAAIEQGQAFDSTELDALCRGLAVDTGAFLHGRERSPRRSVARFRQASVTSPALDDLRLLSVAAEVSRIGGFLASRLEQSIDLRGFRRPEPLQGGEVTWKAGYRLGEEARRGLKPGGAPIKDLEALLRRKGVHVARVAFDSEIEAASLWEERSLPMILLNERKRSVQSSLSRRALLAHELCHLLHDSGEREITTQLSWAPSHEGYRAEVEQRARAFAPAFLAPRAEVRNWFQTKPKAGAMMKVTALARRWGFSLDGAIWHAKSCGLIRSQTATRLHQELIPEDHAWADRFETATPEEGASLVGGLLADLVHRAVARGIISDGRGREILSWS